ncbi:MAG: hypothetical protein TREMPRED_000714 [Tremellales sp. Tagirdzhanova-0007]|nr:MAG: hypothetical protein TREMPRED_000714 [Tremellales sp. Tagirdzhanova-0007]
MGDNTINFYAGQPPLNRLSFHRNSAEKLNRHLESKDARFVIFKELKPLMKKGEAGTTLFLSHKDLEGRIGNRFSGPSPEDAQSKDRSRLFEAARLPYTSPALVFLGVDDRPDASSASVPAAQDPQKPEGVPYFALDAGTEEWNVEGGEWGDARASGSAMPGWEAGIFAQARALLDWNTRNKFCPACGSSTYSLWGGWKRNCTTALEPAKGNGPCPSTKGLHNFAYPRTDPVIIMGILNNQGDEILLGRQKAWPKGMYSCLAGFVEPGETFEDAVRREVMEEAGLEVGPVRYSSSQPWPYPANLMIGCFGRAKDGQVIRLDLDNELEDAQWFSRDLICRITGSTTGSVYTKAELKGLEDKTQSDQEASNALAPSERKEGEALDGNNAAGLTRVPPVTAIAGQLIRLWATDLEKSFPLVHQHLNRTRVMTHALLFEWYGSDSSLKPLLLTGHQDVVPVLSTTRGLWTHDPYGGEYDESTDLIWGRGSSDDKSGTIGALSAIELLLESGKFEPTRTVILALGIDEETGGKVGAQSLSEWLHAKYGPDSIAMLVDEGAGMLEMWEKGYLDVEMTVQTQGGHSSVPPVHTGIGLISLLIAELERNPHSPSLNPESPLFDLLSCTANSAPSMPSELKKAVRKVEKSLAAHCSKVNKAALKRIQDWWVHGSYQDGILEEGLGRAMVSTTQAVDIINGGVKVNALPEVVTAIVNHRISVASSVIELQEHLIDILSPMAVKMNLSMSAFGEEVKLRGCKAHMTEAKAGKIILSEAFNSSLNPAPVSPHTIASPAWRLLSGTVKGVHATRSDAKNDIVKARKQIQMAPGVFPGNTDTKQYWKLTRAIYRFAYLEYGVSNGPGNAHTVDEHMSASGFVEMVRWFMNLVVNVDESREI